MKRFAAGILTLACLFSSVGCAGVPGQQTETPPELGAEVLNRAVYPQMAPYPDEMAFMDQKTGEFDSDGFFEVYTAWQTDRRSQLAQPEGYADGLEDFYAAGIRQFLSDANGENRVYSPLNVYFALGMLAELTDGSSRSQILSLLGAESIEALRSQADALWNANYCDDGAMTSILAASLWLNEDVDFERSTLETLAQVYRASSFRGEMGSQQFNRVLQSWLNEQTDGLLEEQSASIELDSQTLLALATTLCFQAKWADTFSESRTEEGVFHSPSGDVACRLMRQSGQKNYYWGDRFSAIAQRFENGGQMWLVLPDEGVEAQELLEDPQAMDFLLSNGDWAERKYLTVHLSLPKFDVASSLDIIPGLKALGITDVFDPSVSDFSPMTTQTEEIFLSQALHDARVVIDEEGCKAAAYTVMAMAGSAMPPEENVDFVLDRPFLFVITGEDGAPLFTGVVNQPA